MKKFGERSQLFLANFFFFLVIIYLIFVVGSPSKTLGPHSPQLVYHQTTKKLCVIGKVKTKFFATTANWYKYQLTVASW